jgi:SAM-dependent methyltransferase
VSATGLDGQRYLTYVERLFEGVPLEGRSLLDVGGGSGLVSFYAALRGAEVVCLEPAAAGSNPAMDDAFDLLENSLGNDAPIRLERQALQELRSERRFDIILLHNSVNHLDEDACRRLRRDPAAWEVYVQLFRLLRDMTQTGGELIIADCARLNLFGMLHVRNPFAPAIVWPLHQQPETWAELAQQAGYASPRVRWNAMTRTGRVGRVLLSNRVGAFMTQSHFTLTLQARPQ